MTDYSMNIGIPEAPRPLEDMGFMNLPPSPTNPPTQIPSTIAPLVLPSPLVNETIKTADSQKQELGPGTYLLDGHQGGPISGY